MAAALAEPGACTARVRESAAPPPYAAMICSKLRSDGNWLSRLIACTFDCMKEDIDLRALRDSLSSNDVAAFVLCTALAVCISASRCCTGACDATVPFAVFVVPTDCCACDTTCENTISQSVWPVGRKGLAVVPSCPNVLGCARMNNKPSHTLFLTRFQRVRAGFFSMSGQ